MSFPKYDRYKDSGVERLGEVPEQWEIKKLKQVANIRLSNIDKHTVEGQQKVSLCNYLDVYRNERISSSINFMQATASDDQIERLGLIEGDVIITKDSEDPSDIGVPALIMENIPNLVCGYHLALIRSKETNGKFLHYLFCSNFVRSIFETEATGLTRYALGKYSIENLTFAVPPLPEQQSIATFLDHETTKIDELIAEQQRLIDLLKEKRQAVISHAVTKGLNSDAPMKDSAIEWLGKVPEHWDITRIKWYFDTASGGTPDTSKQDLYYAEEEGIPWIRTTDLGNDVLSSFEVSITEKALCDTACAVLPVETVMVAMYGGDGTIGKNGILAIPATINQAVCGLLPNSSFVSTFTFRYIQFYRPHWMIGAESSRKDPNISQALIRNAPILRPPLEEQNQIVTFIDRETAKFDELIAEAHRAIALLQERRTALISAAVTGKIDVRSLV